MWHGLARRLSGPAGVVSTSTCLLASACAILGVALVPNACAARSAPADASGYLAISAGGQFACGIRADYTVACWGNDLYAQAKPPAGQYSQISAGAFHACGVLDSHGVVCWGFYGTQTIAAPGQGFSSASAGYETDCGIETDSSSMLCWNLRHGGTAAVDGHFVSASVGVDDWCGLQSSQIISCQPFSPDDGSAASTDATTTPTAAAASPATPAASPTGSAAPSNAAASPTGSAAPSNASASPTAPAASPIPTTSSSGTFTALSGGTSYFCGLRTDGTVSCWGSAQEGIIGSPPSGTFTQISVGRSHGCALRADRTAVCWGYDGHGETKVPAGTFTQLSVGDDFSCGIHSDGTVLCWGNNAFGQLNVPYNLANASITLANSFGDLAGSLVVVSVDEHGTLRKEDGFVLTSNADRVVVLTAGAMLRHASRTAISVTAGSASARYVPDAVAVSGGAHTTGMVALLSIRVGGFRSAHWGNSYRLVQQPSVFALYHSPTGGLNSAISSLTLRAVGDDRHDSLGSFWLETVKNPPGIRPGDPLVATDGSLMGIMVDVQADGTSFAAPSNWLRPVVDTLVKLLPGSS